MREYREAQSDVAVPMGARCFWAHPATPAIIGDMSKRTWVSTGTRWEALVGYARAVRIGDHVWVSGTTATGADGGLVGEDAAAQMRFILQKIERALNQLGADLRDVVRTRIYISDIRDWEAVARVHGEVFGDIRPANTLVQAKLVGEEYLVEVEADAFIGHAS